MSDKERLFPGAPDGSYVNEDGWLIVDSSTEAWLPSEWATTLEKPPGTRQPGRSGRPRRYFTEEARIEAKRRNDQESYRRRRYQLRKTNDAEMRRSA